MFSSRLLQVPHCAHRVLLQGDVPVVVLPLGQDEVPGLVSQDGRPLGPGGAAVRVNDTLARHNKVRNLICGYCLGLSAK